ncbi:tetratricopeptide repeat protein, partial [bacterium]|nr:tetratricopeptide repeat protein [bacterium]
VKRPLTTYYDLIDVDQLDGLLVNYLRKDRALREMRIETEAFLKSVSESPDLLKELVGDRGKQYRFFKKNPNIESLVHQHFVKDNDFREAILGHFKTFDDAHEKLVESTLAANPEATAPEQKPYAVVELDVLEKLTADISKLNEMIPVETADSWLSSELAKANESGNIPLLVRIQAVFAALEKPEGIPEGRMVALVGDEELWPQIGIAGKLWILKQYAKSKPEEAIRYLEESKTEYMNTDTELGVHGLLAECYQQVGRVRDAIEAYKTLIKRFAAADEAGAAAIKIGRLEIEEGNYQAAREELELILHRNEWRGQRHGDALLWIGRAYVKEGKLPEAHGFFERIMLGYPGFNELLAIAYYEDIKVLKSMGEMESAKTVFEAFKMTPGLDETETADLIRKEFE